MANACAYKMKITGGEEKIKELLAMLYREGNYEETGFTGVLGISAEEIRLTTLPEVFEVEVTGYCAWSIKHALQAYNDRHPSLESETERLGLVVEAFSVEPGSAFQEHVLIANGDVVLEDCVDYKEYIVEGYDSIEKYNAEHGTNFTQDMVNADGMVCEGGFGKTYGRFQNVSKYFNAEHEARSDAGVGLEELEVQALYESDDEFGSVVKAPNGKFFNYYSKDALKHGYGSVGPFESFERAEETLFKHRPSMRAFSIEGAWEAVCSGDVDFIKMAYDNKLLTAPHSYKAFGKEHSFIMGALRNGQYDMVNILAGYGETIFEHEAAEYKGIMSTILYDDQLVQTARKGNVSVIDEVKLAQYIKEDMIMEFDSAEECMEYFNTYDSQNFKTVDEMKQFQAQYGFGHNGKWYHISFDEALDVRSDSVPKKSLNEQINSAKVQSQALQEDIREEPHKDSR